MQKSKLYRVDQRVDRGTQNYTYKVVMFFFDSLEVGHHNGGFSSFSRAGQTNNAEGSFFLTFRSNREIFFCSFFRLSGWWGNERNYFCFFERKTPSLFNCFSNFITWCSESYLGLVWHFAKRFFLKIWIFSLSSMNFFFAVGSFSVCVFLFSLFVFVFREQEMMMRWRIWYM